MKISDLLHSTAFISGKIPEEFTPSNCYIGFVKPLPNSDKHSTIDSKGILSARPCNSHPKSAVMDKVIIIALIVMLTLLYTVYRYMIFAP